MVCLGLVQKPGLVRSEVRFREPELEPGCREWATVLGLFQWEVHRQQLVEEWAKVRLEPLFV